MRSLDDDDDTLLGSATELAVLQGQLPPMLLNMPERPLGLGQVLPGVVAISGKETCECPIHRLTLRLRVAIKILEGGWRLFLGEINIFAKKKWVNRPYHGCPDRCRPMAMPMVFAKSRTTYRHVASYFSVISVETTFKLKDPNILVRIWPLKSSCAFQ